MNFLLGRSSPDFVYGSVILSTYFCGKFHTKMGMWVNRFNRYYSQWVLWSKCDPIMNSFTARRGVLDVSGGCLLFKHQWHQWLHSHSFEPRVPAVLEPCEPIARYHVVQQWHQATRFPIFQVDVCMGPELNPWGDMGFGIWMILDDLCEFLGLKSTLKQMIWLAHEGNHFSADGIWPWYHWAFSIPFHPFPLKHWWKLDSMSSWLCVHPWFPECWATENFHSMGELPASHLTFLKDTEEIAAEKRGKKSHDLPRGHFS